MKIPNIERETCFLFNEAEATADVQIANRKLKRRMEQIRADYPDEVRLVSEDEHFTAYIIPKKWIHVRPPKKMSDEARAKLAERGRMSLQRHRSTNFVGE